MKVRLLVKEGAHKDREIPLPETMFLIGRGPDCHLRPHCRAVSTLHCAIAIWAGKVRVRDMQSRNGTRINGRLVEGEVVAQDGDVLRVGTLEFEFRIVAEPGDLVPAPVANEGDVGWLLSAPCDSAVLSPSQLTGVLDLEPEAGAATPANGTPTESLSLDAAPASSPPAPAGTRSLSAGRHFRDYFAQRRRNSTR